MAVGLTQDAELFPVDGIRLATGRAGIKRQKNIDESLNDFPYVNGGLFEENLRTAYFNSKTREVFLECCDFEWSNISPAIFYHIPVHLLVFIL